ncbi:hypothetical protein PSFL111601_26945 [Pseudomonas floridensis]
MAIAVDHAAQLTMAVIGVLHQRLDRLIVDNALDRAQTGRVFFVVQMHPNAAGGADVG